MTLDAERERAAVLAEQRSKLEAALQKAATDAAAAEAEAVAARQEAAALAREAQEAAAEAARSQQALTEAKDANSELGWKLGAAVEVVETQHKELQERKEQVGQLQKEVLSTREWYLINDQPRRGGGGEVSMSLCS